MHTFKNNKQEQKGRAADSQQQQKGGDTVSQLVEQHPEATAQRAFDESLNQSPKVQSQRRLQQSFNQSPRVVAQAKLAETMSQRSVTQQMEQAIQRQDAPEDEELAQRQESLEDEEPLQGKFAAIQKEEMPEEEEPLQARLEPTQRESMDEEEEPLQGKFEPLQREAILEEEEPLQSKAEPVQQKENRTGLPDGLKAGVENLSGIAVDDVKVSYNSARPAQLNALAYTQGTEIHVGPGQEQHLAHEAWHVAQQKQGRVRPTTQAKGVAINDDQGLEREADRMGEQANERGQSILQSKEASGADSVAKQNEQTASAQQSSATTAQLKWMDRGTDNLYWDKLIDGVQWYFNTKTDRFLYKVLHRKALPSGWEEIILKNASKPLTEEQLDALGFEEIELDEGENIIEKINPPTEEEAESLYRERQVRGELKPRTQLVSPEDVARSMLKALSADWSPIDAAVGDRAQRVFPILEKGIKTGAIELTPDLIKKINETLTYLGKGMKGSKQVSEALAELEHIANIFATVELAQPAVLGAQGPEWSPNQWEPIEAEVTHGQLPPLDVIRLEADAYYRSADGVLHLDEVKDTPRALAYKAKAGEQIKRQVQWLKKAVIENENVVVKQVGYFVPTPEPKFEDVLSPVVIANLKLIDAAQKPGLKFINIAGVHFSIDELTHLYEYALWWLGESEPALTQKGIKTSTAGNMYFGNVHSALKMLTTEPLKPTKEVVQ